MTWSINVQWVPAKDAHALLSAKYASAYPAPSAEQSEQAAASFKAIEDIIRAVEPNGEGEVAVTVSAHASVDHKEADYVTVSIYRKAA